MSKQKELKAARAAVNGLEFGTDAWEVAMEKVRALVAEIAAAAPAEEFCSVDSGIHRTRYADGSIA